MCGRKQHSRGNANATRPPHPLVACASQVTGNWYSRSSSRSHCCSPARLLAHSARQDAAAGQGGRHKIAHSRWQVRALVRGRDPEAVAAIPQSVKVIPGDIGDYKACHNAMIGVDKVPHPPPPAVTKRKEWGSCRGQIVDAMAGWWRAARAAISGAHSGEPAGHLHSDGALGLDRRLAACGGERRQEPMQGLHGAPLRPSPAPCMPASRSKLSDCWLLTRQQGVVSQLRVYVPRCGRSSRSGSLRLFAASCAQSSRSGSSDGTNQVVLPRCSLLTGGLAPPRCPQDRQNQKSRKEDPGQRSRVAKAVVVDFKFAEHRDSWGITQVGLPQVRATVLGLYTLGLTHIVSCEACKSVCSRRCINWNCDIKLYS